MKTRLVFSIILASVLLVTYFVYSYVESSQTSILKTNCATYFDLMYESWDNANTSLADILQGQTFLAQSFRTDKCATSISDWAHLSDNTDFIWNSGLDWHKISYIGYDENDNMIIYD